MLSIPSLTMKQGFQFFFLPMCIFKRFNCVIVMKHFLSGVENNNNDAKRNYFSSNLAESRVEVGANRDV